MIPPPYPNTPTIPPCFQWVTLSSYESSMTPRRSSGASFKTCFPFSACCLMSETKLGHGPFSSSSSMGVLCFPIKGSSSLNLGFFSLQLSLASLLRGLRKVTSHPAGKFLPSCTFLRNHKSDFLVG